MTPNLNQIDFCKVLFWIIIVLVAGFIGQFGKSLAKYIMNRFGKKPPREAGPDRPFHVEGGQKQDIAKAPDTPPSAGPSLSKEQSKIGEKEMKAELKRKKKEQK